MSDGNSSNIVHSKASTNKGARLSGPLSDSIWAGKCTSFVSSQYFRDFFRYSLRLISLKRPSLELLLGVISLSLSLYLDNAFDCDLRHDYPLFELHPLSFGSRHQ